MGSLYDLIKTRRTIREFQRKEISKTLLEKYIDAARLAPQAANRQPLEYIVVDDEKKSSDVFSMISFAGYLDWDPTQERRPQSYIVILVNKDIQKDLWVSFDVACAAQNIVLAAWEDGVGSCFIGAFDRENVRQSLNIPEKYDIVLLLALGYPAHKSLVENMKDGNIQYRRDSDGTFHVPKRLLKDIIHYNGF